MTTPDTPADVTLGEVYRNIETLRTDMKEAIGNTNDAISRLTFIPAAQYESEHKEIVRRLNSLDNARSWIIRTSVAAILTGAFSALFLLYH